MTILKDIVQNANGREVEIFIEVDEKQLSRRPDTRGPVSQIKDMREAMEKAMESIKICAEHTANTLQSIAEGVRPHGCEVQLAIKFDAEVGAMIAKVSSEAQLQVTLRWNDIG